MDTLKLIVKTMKLQEQKDFRKFIHNQKKLEKRQDLEPFDLLAHKNDDINLEL